MCLINPVRLVLIVIIVFIFVVGFPNWPKDFICFLSTKLTIRLKSHILLWWCVVCVYLKSRILVFSNDVTWARLTLILVFLPQTMCCLLKCFSCYISRSMELYRSKIFQGVGTGDGCKYTLSQIFGVDTPSSFCSNSITPSNLRFILRKKRSIYCFSDARSCHSVPC